MITADVTWTVRWTVHRTVRVTSYGHYDFNIHFDGIWRFQLNARHFYGLRVQKYSFRGKHIQKQGIFGCDDFFLRCYLQHIFI